MNLFDKLRKNPYKKLKIRRKIKPLIFGTLLLGSILIRVKRITLLQILLSGFALLGGYDSLTYFTLLLRRLNIVRAFEIPFLALGVMLIAWGLVGAKKEEASRYGEAPIDRSRARSSIPLGIAKLSLSLFIGIFLIVYYICVSEVLGRIMGPYKYNVPFLDPGQAQYALAMFFTGILIIVTECYIVCSAFNIWEELHHRLRRPFS